MALTRWSEDAARSIVYMVMRSTGPAGLTRSMLADRLAGRLNYAQVSESISRLLGDGYIVAGRGYKPSGKPQRVYLVDPNAPIPPIRGLENEIVLSMITDCSAGVSLETMAQQRGVDPREIRTVADDLCRRGLARLIVMPARHGGGIGYVPIEPTSTAPLEINCQLDGGVLLIRDDQRMNLSSAELATLRGVMAAMHSAAQQSSAQRA